MILSIFITLLGLILILSGANFLVDGASSVAKKLGVSDLVVGLTIVAFGTSAPELVISVISAIDGSAQLAVGNVVGSNVFNILVIIGITSIVRPIVVEHSILSNEIPLVILSSLALFAVSSDVLIEKSSVNVVSTIDGIILLLFFLIFMKYTFSKARQKVADENKENVKLMSGWKATLFIIGGLVALIGGGDLFVDGASGIAKGLGVSEAVIGLTIVAMGTSLPELATSIIAALKGQQGIAIGNVVGSCLFNVFFVLGCSAIVAPLPLGDIGLVDMSMLLVSSFLFWFFGSFYRERTFTRLEGSFMALLYSSYVIYLIANV